jgi:hypothetical protein
MLGRQFNYIIGSPRSGTTWLQMMLGAHPSVCTTVELTLFCLYTADWIHSWEREARVVARGGPETGLRHLWTEDEFYEFLREFVERVYGRLVEARPDATHVVDKQPSYSGYTGAIDRLVPGARFIHIVRDGRDVAASMLAAHRDMGMTIETVQKAAQVWSRSVRQARTAARFDGRYLEIRYEDLRAEPEAVFAKVLDFCGLEADAETTARIVAAHEFDKMAERGEMQAGTRAPRGFFRRGVTDTWRTELTTAQRYLFDRTAGDLLRELGYAGEGWWAGPRSSALTRLLRASAILARHEVPARAKGAAEALLGKQLTMPQKAKAGVSRGGPNGA